MENAGTMTSLSNRKGAFHRCPNLYIFSFFYGSAFTLTNLLLWLHSSCLLEMGTAELGRQFNMSLLNLHPCTIQGLGAWSLEGTVNTSARHVMNTQKIEDKHFSPTNWVIIRDHLLPNAGNCSTIRAVGISTQMHHTRRYYDCAFHMHWLDLAHLCPLRLTKQMLLALLQGVQFTPQQLANPQWQH